MLMQVTIQKDQLLVQVLLLMQLVKLDVQLELGKMRLDKTLVRTLKRVTILLVRRQLVQLWVGQMQLPRYLVKQELTKMKQARMIVSNHQMVTIHLEQLVELVQILVLLQQPHLRPHVQQELTAVTHLRILQQIQYLVLMLPRATILLVLTITME